MKNQWNQFPFVLRRKILLTFLAGLASIALSLIIFIITTDHILLVLGSISQFPQSGERVFETGICRYHGNR